MTDIIKFNEEHTPKTEIGTLGNSRSHDIKTKLFNLFTLSSGLSHSDTDFIAVDDKGAETPATQQDIAKALRTNLVELTESLGLSVDQVTESHTEQAQDTVKTIVSNLQEIAEHPHEHSNGDIDTLGDIVYSYVSDLRNTLGLEGNSENSKNTLKEQLQELYSLNDSMFGDDIHALPRFTDGSEIKAKDLADMNMQTLDVIADMLGFELEEGATQLVQPQADKLNVDMLNKLHEVQDHVLKSGQTAVGKNRITTAVAFLEAGLGVIDHEEE